MHHTPFLADPKPIDLAKPSRERPKIHIGKAQSRASLRKLADAWYADGNARAMGASGVSSAPVGNTGVDFTSLVSDQTFTSAYLSTPSESDQHLKISLDWITCSGSREDVFAFADELETFFDVELDETPEAGRHGYHNARVASCGAFIAWSHDRPDAIVVFPGASLSAMSADESFHLLKRLVANRLRPTRIDIAADDYARRVTPGKAYRAFRRGHVHGFQVAWFYDGGRASAGRALRGKYSTGEDATYQPPTKSTGETVYFGRRGKSGAGRQLVIYDKRAESGSDELDCIRWECRLYQERARDAVFVLLDSADASDFVARLGSIVGGSIAFITRTDKNLDRCKLLPWWREMSAAFGSCKWKRPSRKIDLFRTLHALVSQYGPTLCAVQIAFDLLGGGDLNAFLVDASLESAEALSSKHVRAIAAAVQSSGLSRDDVAACVNSYKELAHAKMPRS